MIGNPGGLREDRLNSRVLTVAERVIRKTERENPADAILRLELRSERGLAPAEAALISRAVFSYFRWRGWLDLEQPMDKQILAALDLAEKFAKAPEQFADTDLVSRAVPSWVRSEVQITPEFARALQREPRLWLRARIGQGASLAKRLRNCRILGTGLLADTLEYQGREDLFRKEEFHTGAFELQDLSSQIVGLLCAPSPGETWWDACAGEGGKLLHLSDLMHNQGLIWATDCSEWRLRRLKRRAARAKVFNYRTALWDGGEKLPTKTKFDGILVDAPCSSTGTWQRNPHARWTLTAEDVKELSKIQVELLVRAAGALKRGGKLVYSVCSLTRSESEGVVGELESRCQSLSPLTLANPLDPNPVAMTRVYLWPQQFGGNGMFIAGWGTQ